MTTGNTTASAPVTQVASDELELRQWWRQKPVWVLLFLGFSAGVPYYLIFSSLSLWLREAGVDRSTVTYFSWAVLGYSFKFVWAPLVDRLPLPFLTSWLGRRRGWMLFAQFAIMAAIVMMGITDPLQGLQTMALGAVLLGFASATQDIVIDAYRIEIADSKLQAMLSSTYIAGYRTGMIVAGAGALLLAQWFGSTKETYSLVAWQNTYFCMAAVMLVGVVTTLVISEPKRTLADQYQHPIRDYLRFFFVFLLSIVTLVIVFINTPETPKWFTGYPQVMFSFVFGTMELGLALFAALWVAKACLKLGLVNSEMVYEGYQAPILDFFRRYKKLAVWVLLLIGCYRISDIVLGVITNVFYQDMGYSKAEIAGVTKVFGIVMTITGAFLGGMLALRIGVMRALMAGAIFVVIANLSFLWLTGIGVEHTYLEIPFPSLHGWNWLPFPIELTLVIIIDNLTQGLALAAFIAWLSSLTNVSFTATQYAIFSSLMTLLPKLIGGYSGTMVDFIGYTYFFLFASVLGIPVIWLIYFLSSRLAVNDQVNS